MADERLKEMKAFLDKQKRLLKNMIPAVGMDEDDLIRAAMHAAVKTPKIALCTRESLWLALSQLAQLGLRPGTATGECHIQPNNNKKKDRQGNEYWEMEATPIIGYRGYITLARRSGKIRSIQAQIIYEHDFVDVEYTRLEKPIIHKPVIDRHPGKMVAVYCMWVETDNPGEPLVEIMRRDQVDTIRDKAVRRQGYSPWSDNYDEMSRKTTIRRAQKRWSLSEDDLVAKAERINQKSEGDVFDDIPTAPDDPFADTPPAAATEPETKRRGTRGARARAVNALASPGPNDVAEQVKRPEPEPIEMQADAPEEKPETNSADTAIFDAPPDDGDDEN